MDFDSLFKKKIEPPINLNDYKDNLNSTNMTSNNEISNIENSKKKEGEIIFNDFDYEERNADLNRVRNFTYIRSPRDNVSEDDDF